MKTLLSRKSFKRFALLFAFTSAVNVWAQPRSFEMSLWNKGEITSPHSDTLVVNESKGLFRPTLYVYLPDAAINTGRAVVACPGGGYSHLAMDHEGRDWAPFFNERGIALIVLKYRMPFGDSSVPLSDAKKAMLTVRQHAAEWKVNPNDVGVMGSSAGGHLASTLATHSDFSTRPNFQILFYPVISMDSKWTHWGSHCQLIGEKATDEVVNYFSSDKQVAKRLTPPAIMLLSDDDKVVVPYNSVSYYNALQRFEIPASLHIYPSGGHGWGYRTNFAFHNEMLADLSAWLKQLKAVKRDAIKVACVGNSITNGHGIRYTERDGYPAQLQKMLGDDYWVRNFGLSGRTLMIKGDHPYMKEYMFTEAKNFNPDVVVIKLGTNDSKPKNWVYQKDFEKDLQLLIDEFKKLDSHPQIVLSYPAWAFENPFTISDSVIVNGEIPLIKKVAKKNKLPIIDFHTAMMGKKELLQKDGVHPNEKGANFMAGLVYSKLVELDDARRSNKKYK